MCRVNENPPLSSAFDNNNCLLLEDGCGYEKRENLFIFLLVGQFIGVPDCSRFMLAISITVVKKKNQVSYSCKLFFLD